jgi:ATP-dependent protease HslVU (ClpYQ) peptidase subunit
MNPTRIQLSRAKGWRMPENTLKVDRTTKWGNPFMVGKHGTAAECVDLFEKLAHGYVCISKGLDLARAQSDFLKHWSASRAELRGKNLACWCRSGWACHADVLLSLVNAKISKAV